MGSPPCRRLFESAAFHFGSSAWSVCSPVLYVGEKKERLDGLGSPDS